MWTYSLFLHNTHPQAYNILFNLGFFNVIIAPPLRNKLNVPDSLGTRSDTTVLEHNIK